METWSIVLAVVGLTFSVLGLIVSIVFGSFIFNLHKKIVENERQIQKLNRYTDALVVSCGIIYDNHTIPGRLLVNYIKEKYHYEDDLSAVIFLKDSNEEIIVNEYLKTLIKKKEV